MSVAETNEDFIEAERRAFFETDNPLHAWAAFRFAEVVRAEIPGWVRTYLDLVAQRIVALAAEANASGSNRVDDFGPRLAAALMMKGSHLTGYYSDWITHGMNVRHRMQGGDKEKHAVEAVAEVAGVHPSTVRRGFKRYDRLFPGDRIFPDEAVSKSR